MKLTVTRKLPGCPEAILTRHYHDVTVKDVAKPLSPADLEKAVADADVVICTLNDRIDEALLSKAPHLKCLITFSVGLDHVDVPAVLKRKIKLVHTPNVLTDATADLTWTLILGCARRIKPAVRFLEEGKWSGFDPSLFLGIELQGKTLGIVGMGKIGTAVAARARGFGMKVVYCRSKKAAGVAARDSNETTLDAILNSADVITLHCPLTDETKHLIGRRELGIMKREAILVNTARGPIVDEAALLAHLRTNPGFFAGLDVFEKEPFVGEALRFLPNALCVPHIGSATDTAREAMGRVCLEEAVRYAKGEALQYEYRDPKP